MLWRLSYFEDLFIRGGEGVREEETDEDRKAERKRTFASSGSLSKWLQSWSWPNVNP